jgi:hypothetical protein
MMARHGALQGPGRFEMPSKQDVTAYIRANFQSVWALELLVYLRQKRERSLSHAEMVAGLRGSDRVVRQGVGSLAAAGLVEAEADGSARYRPESPALEQMGERIVSLYRTRPDSVRRTIAAAANPNIAAFADAFRLRKD